MSELIKALKDAEGYIRYVAPSCIASDEAKEAIRAAADALEAADIKIADYTAAVEALDDSNDAYIKENERLKKRIAEHEAKMPKEKEGEWLRTDAFPHRIYCSVCYKTYVPNDRWQIWVDDELPKNYCPNCGAKMKGANDE